MRHLLPLVLLSLVLLAPFGSALTQDYFPGTETVVQGTVGGAAFPGALQTSDDGYRVPDELDVAADTTHDPDAQVLTKGTNCGGTFPGDLTTSNNAYVCHREANQAAAPTVLTPDTETLTKAVSVSGTLADVNSNNAVSRVIREQDQAAADVNDDPDSQTLTTGTQTGGTFATCIATSDDVDCSYQEANVGGTPTEEIGAAYYRDNVDGTPCSSCPHTTDWTGSAWGTPEVELSTHGASYATPYVVWNPTAGSTEHYLALYAGADTTLRVYKCTAVDTCSSDVTATQAVGSNYVHRNLAFEQSSKDLLWVYDCAIADAAKDLCYKTKPDGGSWSAELYLDHAGVASTNPSLASTVLVSNPGTNYIALGIMDITNDDYLLGMWDGTAWLTGDHQAICSTDTTTQATIGSNGDVAMEDTADEFVAYCGRGTNTDAECEWTAAAGWEDTAGSPATCATFDADASANNDMAAMRAAGREGSNIALACDMDDLADINCWRFTGAAGTGGTRGTGAELTANDGSGGTMGRLTVGFAWNPDQTGTTDLVYWYYDNVAGTIEWGTYNDGTDAFSCTGSGCSNLASAGSHIWVWGTSTQSATNSFKAHMLTSNSNLDILAYRASCSAPGAGCTVDTMNGETTLSTSITDQNGQHFTFGVQETPATPTNYNLDIRYEWAAVAAADTYTLHVEATEFDAGDTEDMLVQTDDGSEGSFTTRYTFTSDTDSTQATYQLTAGEYDAGAPMIRFIGATESSDTTQGTTTLDRVTLIRGFTDDYELEYRLAWTTETCADSRVLTVNAWRTGANMENVDVQVLDSTEVTYTTRLTVTATADGTTLTYTLTADEWDSGDPNIRMLGTTETGDTLQGDFSMDYVVIECVPAADYEMEYRLSWSEGASACMTPEFGAVTLRVEAYSPTEFVDVQIDDGTDLGVFVSLLTITKVADDDAYQTATVNAARWDGGEPLIRFLGVDEAGDSTQSDLFIDDVEFLCVNRDWTASIEYAWSGIPAGATSYELIVECARGLGLVVENGLLQVLTPPATWNTRYTCDQNVDTTYSGYLLTSDEFNAGSPTFRLQDIDPTDNEESWWNLDLLLIRRDYTIADEPGGRGGVVARFLTVTCERTDYFRSYCLVELHRDAIGVGLQQTDWYADGQYFGMGKPAGERREIVWLERFELRRDLNITVIAHLTNGQSGAKSASLTLDNMWVLGVAALTVSAVGTALLYRHHTRRNRSQSV